MHSKLYIRKIRLHVPIKLVLGLPWPKRSGVVVNYSPPYTTEVKNEWGYTSTPSICLRGVDRAALPLNLFQVKPARCTLLLGIFISTSVHVSGNYVPIIRRTYCIYATLVFFTLYGWLFGMRLIPTSRPRQPPIQSEK